MEIPRDNAESAGEVSSESDARLAGEASIDAASVDVESTDNDAESAGLASTDVQRRAANTEAGELTALLVAHDARALTFVRSRPGTERVAEVAQKRLAKSASHLAGTVAAYRGGYLPEERRELEQQLRTGDIRALATTSALELGMDISGLDAVIVTGWPGTHSSFQQQIGRAGRAGSTGLAVFIGRDNPLDQYLLANPKLLATGRAEATVLDPTNPWILPHHLAAAAFELPLTNSDLMVFDLSNTVLIEHMVDAGMLTERPQGWYWNPAMRVSPHDLADIRGGGSTISIINSENGSLLGTVDGARADTTVHPGAIYIHQGVPFEVESLDDDVALVHPHRDEEIRTFAREESSVEILDTTDEIVFADGTWSRGMVVVRSRVIGYDVRRVRDGMFLGFVPLTMPMREFTTGAVWATLTEQATRDAGIATADLPGALHGAEHTMIALLPFFVSCDRWDLGGLSTALHPQTGRPTIIVHDAIAGGSGCAHRGFTSGKEWLEATLDTLTTCPCESGCPKCIQSPKCGNNNSPLSKPDARLLMDLLVRQLPEPSTAS
ncbi:MAG: DUF1998 domain-containing protein [Actinomycetaceae bacterium]|nr:DUF1998 domain-containing protein [Actinomycetaceae bacterium]